MNRTIVCSGVSNASEHPCIETEMNAMIVGIHASGMRSAQSFSIRFLSLNKGVDRSTRF